MFSKNNLVNLISKIIRKALLSFLILINNSKFLDFYINVNLYSRILKKNSKENLDNNVCIVIHGNIIRENNFTFSNIQNIREIHKKIKIVFSTNSLLSRNELNFLKENSCDVLINKKLINSGFLNFNNQKVNTLNGLKLIKARYKEVEYALKLRSDQFFSNSSTIPSLIQLLNSCKVNRNKKISSRIICLSFNTLKNIPFHINDMFQFGKINDLIFYWSASKSQGFSITWKDYYKNKNSLEFSRNTPEIYLNFNFYKKIKNNKEYLLSNYYLFISEYFILIDTQSIGFFWKKYYPVSFQDNNINHPNFHSLTYLDWLRIYNDKNCFQK